MDPDREASRRLAEIDRINKDIARVGRELAPVAQEDRRWLGRVWLGPIGTLYGLGSGAILVSLLAFVKFMNPISALGMLLGTTILGWIFGLRRKPRRASSKHLALQREYLKMRRSQRNELEVKYDQFIAFSNTLAAGDSGNALPPASSSPPSPLPAAPTPVPPALSSHPGTELLINAKRGGTLIPWVGGDLSRDTDVTGGFPGWRELPARLLDEGNKYALTWNTPEDRDTLHARLLEQGAMTRASVRRELDVVKQKLGVHYGDALAAIFRPVGAAPGAAHRAVLALEARVVLTASCDELLESVDTAERLSVYTWRRTSDAIAEIRRNSRRVLYKTHGNADGSAVLTHDERAKAHADADADYGAVVRHLAGHNSFLFVGFCEEDPRDLEDSVLEDFSDVFSRSPVDHYALVKRLADGHEEAERRERLRKRRITVISYEDRSDLVPILDYIARA